jgi:hypothetical protein
MGDGATVVQLVHQHLEGERSPIPVPAAAGHVCAGPCEFRRGEFRREFG